VDHPPSAVRLVTRTSEVTTKIRKGVPFLLKLAVYMHCSSAGQAKCGGNWLRQAVKPAFSNVRLIQIKRAFERSAGLPKTAIAMLTTRPHCLTSAPISHAAGPQIAEAA
jgi:hypothetical protein